MFYVKDLSNTIYIGIDNVENINCYFITSLQILHSSKTVKETILKNKEYLLKSFPQLFSPLIIYEEGIDKIKSSLNIDNVSELAYKIKETIYENKPIIRDGYNWLTLLINYYIPILFSLLEDKKDIFKILIEISLEPQQFATDLRFDIPFLNNESKDILLSILNDYNEKFASIVEQYYNTEKTLYYNCIALETYIDDDKYGHVFPIVRNEKDLYVLDNHYMEPIYHYLISRNHINVEKLRLNYYSHDLLNIFNNYFKTTEKDYNGFVINQYSLVFRRFDKYIKDNKLYIENTHAFNILDKITTQETEKETSQETKQKTKINIEEINKQKTTQETEKETETNKRFEKLKSDYEKLLMFCYFLLFSLFVIIMVIVVSIVSNKHKNISYNESDEC